MATISRRHNINCSQITSSELKVDTTIRSLFTNSFDRYGSEALIESQEKLKYTLVGYSTQIGNDAFGDDGVEHSPIIGWADGNPIYGLMDIVIHQMKIQQ